MKNKRVAVAMSGGVDSSVAAALLKEKGFEVIGLTMCFGLTDEEGKRPSCCGVSAIDDAREVAQQLGIRHYVVNMHGLLEEHVIKDFCLEYSKGRTPNPCVRCNQYIKFDALLRKAFGLDAAFLATGHYARITAGRGHKKPLLKKAKDKKKDQSYFLYRLSQDQLKAILFPLGNYTKDEVRGLARAFGLSVADKKDSQEICFIPGMDYRAFLNRRGIRVKPGAIVDAQGKKLGEHSGVAFYTIGQREGLKVAMGHPDYIKGIDPKAKRIIIGTREEASKRECLIRKPHFVAAPIKKAFAARVKIRYNHKEAPAMLIPFAGMLRIKFAQPQFAITPGQSAVFYERDTVVGGGIIDEVLA